MEFLIIFKGEYLEFEKYKYKICVRDVLYIKILKKKYNGLSMYHFHKDNFELNIINILFESYKTYLCNF